MRIIAILASFLLTGGCATLEYQNPVHDKVLFAWTCIAMEVDCSYLLPPVIVTSQVAFDYSVYGMHFGGEDYIYIRPNLGDDPSWNSVVVHETVHYIHHHLGMAAISGADRCWSEREARTITSEFLGVEYDPSWEENYGCQTAE